MACLLTARCKVFGKLAKCAHPTWCNVNCVQGHSAPTREELEKGASSDSSSSSDSGSPSPGPSGRPSDSHAGHPDGVQRNTKPGEFAPNDPKKPDDNIPEHSRGMGGK